MRALSQRVSRARSRGRSIDLRPDSHEAEVRAGDTAPTSTAPSTATPPAGREDPLGRHSDAPHEVEPDALVITRRRAGLYALSDAEGNTIGQIYGDYVVGFTARYGSQTHLFEDIDDAKAAIAELHAHERSAGPPA